MGNIGQLLGRGFMVGVVLAAIFVGIAGFLYLVYRLKKLMEPKEVRQEEKRILSHRLYKVSGRGRIAYLVLCLEETLRFYGQDFSEWEWILRKLWSITDCCENNWIDSWLDSVERLLPSMVLEDGPLGNDPLENGAWEDAAETAPAEIAEISKARILYTQAGTAMIVINAVLETAYRIVCEWSPDAIAHDPSAICLIEKAEETMNTFGVPLPSDEIIEPLLAQKDFSLGKPFDGLNLSYISILNISNI